MKKKIKEYTISDAQGVSASVLNYGALLSKLFVPDTEGNLGDVVLGFDNLNEYLTDHSFLGTTTGRFANRIAHGRFSLNDQTYTLAKNIGQHHLHGGEKGFNAVFWDVIDLCPNKITLQYVSLDGEEGYPGTLEVHVTYRISGTTLSIEYSCNTDKTTVVNLTNHSYFNLSAGRESTIENHTLELQSDHILHTDVDSIPTGEYVSVTGTPFDFRSEKYIGKDIDSDHPLLAIGEGYDHCYVLHDRLLESPQSMGVLRDEVSGRRMEIWTTEPAVQLYSGNYLPNPMQGKHTYGFRSGVCLETQHFPDSPNQPHFPSTVLQPGDIRKSVTQFKF